MKKEKNLKKSKLSMSSQKWINRNSHDLYVCKSKLEGYRSRSAYKLIEIHEKFKIFQKNMIVLDLGSAPGGWSQVISKYVYSGERNNVIALDILPMKDILGVKFIQTDFITFNIENVLVDLNINYIDILVSDMSPNTMGNRFIDHIRIIELCEKAFLVAISFLSLKGHFIIKVFQGEFSKGLISRLKYYFKEVKIFKPKSSRKESPEFYIIALYKKNNLNLLDIKTYNN